MDSERSPIGIYRVTAAYLVVVATIIIIAEIVGMV